LKSACWQCSWKCALTLTHDTKPIWERALEEILEVKDSLANLERKFDVLSKDMITLRADQSFVHSRIDKIDSRA
jgi:hypothetical protein